jgi:hypothetical protein
VVAADFNGDGKLDLAAAEPNNNTISILFGNGDGTFQSHLDLPVGQGPRALVAVDFNNDRNVDIAVANQTDGTVSILLGNGGGSFGSHVDYPAGLGPVSMAAADFNADGRLDLAVAGSGSAATLQGNGDGTFQAPHSQSVVAKGCLAPFSTVGVVAADFNGDGHPDIAVAGTWSGYCSQDNVSVLLGNGDGSFQNAVGYSCVRFVSSLIAADLNGDGKADLIVGTSYGDPQSLSVLINNGDGTFQPHTDYSAGFAPISVAAGDFNGDGKLDLVTANDQDGDVAVLLGSGDGTFQPHSDYAAGDSSQGIVAADFNRDGILDLATADCGSNAASVLLGNGDGTFRPRTDYALPGEPISIAVSDINHDGKPDAVVLIRGIVSIFFGNGDGSFQPRVDAGGEANSGSFAVGDLDGDGIPDLAITDQSYSGTLLVLLGNGDGSFRGASPATYTLPFTPNAVAIGDFNGDGRIDLAVSQGTSGGGVSILLGVGGGSFLGPVQYGTTHYPHSVITADFNGDGALDLAIGGISSSSILLGNGDGTFQTHMDQVGSASALVAADLDGDGRVDLATAGGASAVSVLLNKPAAQRVSSPPFISSIAPASGTQGQTISNFTVAGNNFDPTASQISFSPPDGIIVAILTRTSTQILASASIASGAAMGTRNVIVTNPDGLQSLPVSFQIFGVAAISVSPSPVLFQNTVVGTTGAAIAVTITNTGNATLHVTGITFSSGEFSSSVQVPFDVPFGQGNTASFNVSFTPATSGLRQGTMQIASNAPTAIVSLQGSGMLVPPPKIASVSLRAIASLLDNNPNASGGLRIFPDKQFPGDTINRRQVQVSAALTASTPGVTVYFRSFDIDDPSSDSAPIDPNGPAGNDNRGSPNCGTLTYFAIGSAVCNASVMTDSNGLATVIFEVTMQPGDNFRVAASLDQNYLAGAIAYGVSIMDAGGTVIPPEQVSELLTVWRRVHVEVDTMGPVSGNSVRGTIIGVQTDSQTELTIDHLLTANGESKNRFANGKIVIDTVGMFRVVSSGKTSLKVDGVIRNAVAKGKSFTLYDDDNFDSSANGNWQALDGDIGKAVHELPQTFALMQDSDDPNANILGPAYIRPVYDGGGTLANNSSTIPFTLNIGGSSTDSTTLANAVQTQLDLGQSSCVHDGTTSEGPCVEANDFWVVYVQLAYQYASSFDNDPDGEFTQSGATRTFVGQLADTIPADCSAVPVGGTGSLVFLEVARDHDVNLGTGTLIRRRVAAHEVGHQFGLHGDTPTGFGIMSLDPNQPLRFVDQHLHILRCRVSSPGR